MNAALADQRLQPTRIQNLKMSSVPVWIFSSFAIRNIISCAFADARCRACISPIAADFHPSIAGALWVPDLLVPDPYFILPVAVGVMGFLNLWARLQIFKSILFDSLGVKIFKKN